MEYIIFAALAAALFKRPLRNFLFGMVGIVFFSLAVVMSVWGGISFMELSKLEILLLLGIFFVSSSNTECDRQINKDWFLSNDHEANMGWLYSKYIDFVWIGVLPFCLSMLDHALYLLSEISDFMPFNDDVDALFNSTTISAVALIYIISVLILRNAYLGFKLSRQKSKSIERNSEKTERDEVANG